MERRSEMVAFFHAIKKPSTKCQRFLAMDKLSGKLNIGFRVQIVQCQSSVVHLY